MKTLQSKRSIGVNFSNGRAEVRVWAPNANRVDVRLVENNSGLINLQKQDFGYWYASTDKLKPNDLYQITLDEENDLPDPAALAQADTVHGPSVAIDLGDFNWTDGQWNNIPLEDYILYELHTGTFTPEGTFAGIIEKLGYLKELGVNAIEIMPVTQFPGNRNWGYDGVLPFAVQNSYGGAAGLQKLVDACHSHGIAVVLDVVYNHMGPEGNYLENFGPYFTAKYNTPWGNAINFDDAGCDGVREFFIENALMWFRDFHIDALRLDAVHAIKDFSATHILREIKLRLDELIQHTGRKHYLIVELDLNDTRFIRPLEKEGFGMDAQWVDEFHHALRVSAGGEPTGYYSDFNGVEHLAKSYRDAYVYDGQYSLHRDKKFGIKAEDCSGKQFIVFSQNHDQVGNRMLGERSAELFSFEMQKLMAGAVIFSPYLPMLFMGEEYAETQRFQYFVSHTDPELAEAVRKGRKQEFAAFHAEGEAPDPMAEETFENSKLQWNLLSKESHQTMLKFYKELISLRKIQPALKQLNREQLRVEHNADKKVVILRRWTEEQQIICLMNFSQQNKHVIIPAETSSWTMVLDSASPDWGGPKASPSEVSSNGKLELSPESFLVYRTRRQPQDEETWQMLGHS